MAEKGCKMMADPKQCTRCGELKPRSDFRPHNKAPRGVMSKCRECEKNIAREIYARNGENCRLSSRRYKMKRAYGITLEQYNEMLVAQEGKCAICGTSTPGGQGNFPVDHDHETGVVRGLLCNLCNVGLGAFQDNPIVLEKAVKYLKGYKK